MKRYLIVSGVICLVFLALFLLVEVLQPALMPDLAGLMNTRSISVALTGIFLLVIDALLPVPSSLVMIAHGALFGVFVGTILSLTGSLGAALLSFWLGRRGQALLRRFVSPEEQQRANQLLAEWGWLAIIMTRPIPLLAETTAVMAGASTMKWRTLLLASLAGSLPVALLYALTGATAMNFDSLALSFSFTLLMAGIFWSVGRLFRSSSLYRGKEVTR